MGNEKKNDEIQKKVADEVEQHRMPLMDHLIELRNRMMWSMAALALGMVASLMYVDEIYAWLIAPFVAALAESQVEGGMSILSPFEGIYTWLRVAFFGGLVIASPMIALQGWLFVAPGLYNKEKRLVVPLAFSSTALFVSGALFCYYVIFPYAFPFFLQIIEVEASISAAMYLSAILKMMGAFGTSFQLPVVTFFFARIGLIDHRDMTGAFRYAIVGIFLVAAVITPPDVLTQSLLAGPLIVLYILSIGVAWLFTTKERAAIEGS